MDAALVLEVSQILMWGGAIIVCASFILLYLSMKHVSTVKLPPQKYSVDVEGESIDENTPPLHTHIEYDAENDQHLVLEWIEKNDREVSISIAERTTPRIGVKQRTYADKTAAKGLIEVDLAKGAYLISFVGARDEIRSVEFTTTATERRRRFKEYQPIALALLTVGTVLFVNGLVLNIGR